MYDVRLKSIYDYCVPVMSNLMAIECMECDCNEVQAMVISELNKLKEVLEMMGGDAQENGKVVFAITAFLDELVFSSSWNQKKKWAQNSLCIRLYKIPNASTEFYSDLEDVLLNKKSSVFALRVYKNILLWGYKGGLKYASQNEFQAYFKRLDIAIKERLSYSSEYYQKGGKSRNTNTGFFFKFPSILRGMINRREYIRIFVIAIVVPLIFAIFYDFWLAVYLNQQILK